MIARRHGDTGTANPAKQLMIVGKRRCAHRLADLPGAVAVDVDHADEVSLFRRRILFGVELAEITDADHCYG